MVSLHSIDGFLFVPCRVDPVAVASQQFFDRVTSLLDLLYNQDPPTTGGPFDHSLEGISRPQCSGILDYTTDFSAPHHISVHCFAR